MVVEKGEKAVRAVPGGFVLWASGTREKPWDDGSFCVRTDEAEARVNLAWFRGGWFDDLTLAWKDVEEGACYDRPAVTEGKPAPGATSSCRSPSLPAPRRPSWSALVVRRDRHIRFGKDPEETSPPWNAGTTLVLHPLLRDEEGARPGVLGTASCVRRRPASRTASTTRPSRPRSSRRWPRISRS